METSLEKEHSGITFQFSWTSIFEWLAWTLPYCRSNKECSWPTSCPSRVWFRTAMAITDDEFVRVRAQCFPWEGDVALKWITGPTSGLGPEVQLHFQKKYKQAHIKYKWNSSRSLKRMQPTNPGRLDSSYVALPATRTRAGRPLNCRVGDGCAMIDRFPYVKNVVVFVVNVQLLSREGFFAFWLFVHFLVNRVCLCFEI